MMRLRWQTAPLMFLALSVALPAAAQTPFVMENIGQQVETDDARMVARGFGMTVTDSLHPGFKNLASLSSLRHVAIVFTGYGEQTKNTGTDGTRELYRTFTPEIRVGAPVFKNRLALTAGFSVYRSSHYDTEQEASWSVWDDEVTGVEQYSRQGSLFAVPLGAALRLPLGLSVAGSANLVGGTLTEATANWYLEPTSGTGFIYQPSSLKDEERYSGTSWTVAGLWSPGRGRVRFGASWTPAYDIDVDRIVELQGVSQRGRSHYLMHMPDEYRAGVQLRPFGRWTVGGDARYQDFGDFAGLVTPDRNWETNMGQEYEYSFGLERVRATERRGGLSNLPLRFSAAYRRWGYAVGDAPIDQRTFSVGTGFPFGHDMGQLDIAVSWSRIGDLEINGYESDVWRLTVSVIGLEEWW